MRPTSLNAIADAVDGLAVGDDVRVTSVATDSRLVRPGALFVAMPGEHTDGSLFVPEAFRFGAAAALVRDGTQTPGPAVFVRSTGDALLKLAAAERRGTGATVVGVTGANGKTSTKDLISAVMNPRMRTHASRASFNNEVGLPMTILDAPADTEALVCEMGARRPGDVALLCQVARPDVVVVTNVGVAHLEIFGSWGSIVESSAEPVDSLDEAGTAVLNADDEVALAYAARCRGRVVMFGLAAGADVRATDATLADDGCASFTLEIEGQRERVDLAVVGQHMVPNALAAAAVASILGLSPGEIAAGLKGASVSPWRMEAFTTAQGVRVINDAYNANPESVAAALKAARWIARGSALIAVLGPMAELGPIAAEEHARVGELASRLRVDRVVTVGEQADTIATAAVREGVDPANVASYADLDGALADVREHARPGDVVLVKASRVAGLERLAEALR
ncbi:MAG: UDP-N-acetylmuramoyl-tripeptide--D-alanyl-D-alanine ligase [Actinobacteria bacterium]|nr:UDP-N-acetylmuramoyl-tripeptide--D-alanyl-D-alanine ligase [Actinomycetota bacterium]